MVLVPGSARPTKISPGRALHLTGHGEDAPGLGGRRAREFVNPHRGWVLVAGHESGEAVGGEPEVSHIYVEPEGRISSAFVDRSSETPRRSLGRIDAVPPSMGGQLLARGSGNAR
jgi:hypothetical protein